jgi:hypothetical protein
MKKLLLTLLIPLIAVSSVSYGEELNSLFGITLYENAEKYASSNYIDSNKIKNVETISGYFDLNISTKITAKSPYVSDYWISIDINNNIHDIYGKKEYSNLSHCKEVLESLLSSLEERYEIDFEYWEPSYPTFKIYSYYHYNSSGDYFAIQCNEDFEYYSTLMQIYIDSKVFGDATEDFYDSGL